MREDLEERAAIMEFDGNMSRADAEILAHLFSDDSDSADPCGCDICKIAAINPSADIDPR